MASKIPAYKDIDDWAAYWKRGHINFHLLEVNPILIKHLDYLLDGKKKLTILVPLSGKTLDMKYLVDLGHSVIGVEGVELPVIDFFKEHNLKYSISPLPIPGSLYQAENSSIKIYHCDLFQLSRSLIGEVDSIWDRGAFVAINEEDRQKYTNLVLTFLEPGGRILLNTVEYDKTKFAGPPHSVSNEDVDQCFGSSCKIKELFNEDQTTQRMRDNWKLDLVYQKVHLIIKKKY